MNWEWSFRKLPIQPLQLMALVLLALLSLWAQTGFNVDRNHLLFFISNYSTWVLLLPFAYQLSQLIQRPYRGWTLIKGVFGLISVHWISSNVLLYLLRYTFGEVLLPNLQEIQAFLIPSLASRLIDLALLLGLLSWLYQQQVLSTQKVLMAESQALVERSKLQALKSQLNPHFLFNSLHSINTLIGSDPQQASEMIIKMSQLLRTMLAINEREEHILSDEVNFVKQYLSIESERFKDRLSIELEVQAAAKSIVVPTMTLQPLVENAFKHGISKMTGKTILGIDIKSNERSLNILVRNEVPKVNNQRAHEGIGLVNLSDRLKAYYGDQVKLETHQKEGLFEALITIER